VYSKQEIMQDAKLFIEEHNITSYPTDVAQLCRKKDITVFEQSLPLSVSGFIVIQDEPFQNFGTGRLIAVNKEDSAGRKRFTIAHELAHYMLHRNPNEPIYAHRSAGQNDGMEREANIFASIILMPENLVKEVLEQFQGDAPIRITAGMMVERISYLFAVSRDAAAVRLEQLELV